MEVDGRDGTAESESAIEFAKSENKKVRIWRVIVLIVLLITGLIITLATYFFLDNSADADHQETVRSNCVLEQIATAHSCSLTYSTNQSFIFISIPCIPKQLSRLLLTIWQSLKRS
jgi:hypothetical protein